MNALTVVIPTYNRAGILQKALDAYRMQSAPELIQELIVVDDGSTDETQVVVLGALRDSPFPVHYLRQSNKGPAAARNMGIREAASELILFTDDDIIPERTLVAEHLRWHNRFSESSVAVLGYVTWSPEVNATPFMKWYGSDGPLFAYARFSHRIEIEHAYFYSCNLSLKTEFLRKCGTFDEDFKVAACEDLELGYRLNKAGMQLLYNREALAYHHQHVSFEDACRRAKKCSTAWEVFGRKEAGRAQKAPRRLTLYRLLKKRMASPLAPFKGFMSSRVPLPWIVYRAMFAIYR
jgi:glycosyltransferase involved in cell wall biosynthesis